jgi:hypothetical protein
MSGSVSDRAVSARNNGAMAPVRLAPGMTWRARSGSWRPAMRLIAAALVAVRLAGAPAPAAASDLIEPRVLLGDDAARLAALIGDGEGAGVRPGADVAVIVIEPAGFVWLVLIDSVARRKTWTRMSIADFERLLRGLGRQAWAR